MDAYTEMMLRLSNARLADLCREAERHRLATPLVGWRRKRAAESPERPVADVATLPEPAPALALADDEPLRRSA